MKTSSNHVINGTADVTGLWIGGSQRTNHSEEIIINVKLTDVHNGGDVHRRDTWNVLALNGTDRSSGMWLLMARIGRVLWSLQRSHANNTNVHGSSGHAGEDIGWLETMGPHNVNFDVSNKMQHEGLDGAIASTMEISKETFQKIAITQEDATEAHHVKIASPILATLEE